MAAYDAQFFATLNEAGSASAQAILQLAFAQLNPRSVVDVGCGTGIWSAAALDLGVPDVLAIDGDYVPTDQRHVSGHHFRAVDLSHPFELGRRFDVAVCVEVAEHLDAGRADGLVADLVRHADAIVFSAAPPGQGGTHHVNEQWPDYWVARFESHGYSCWDMLRPRIRYNPRVAWIYRQNVFVVVRDGHPATPSGDDPAMRLRPPAVADVAFQYVATYLLEREESAKVALKRAVRNRVRAALASVRGAVRERRLS